MITQIRKTHFWLFVALLCWTPLPLASNRPWSWMLLELAAGFLIFVWALLGGLDRTPAPVGLRWILIPLLLFSATLVWGLTQALPLPREAIGLDPTAAMDGVRRLMSYGGLFFLALQYGRTTRQAEQLVMALAAAGALYAGYGLAVFLSGSETILGMEKWAYRGYLTSSFVNRNNFATYAGLSLLSQIALASRRFGGKGMREICRMLLVEGDKSAWLLIVGGGLTLAALLLTGSRGGCFATVYGGFILAMSLRRISGRRMIAAAILPLLALGGLMWALQDGEIGQVSELDDRLAMDELTWQAILIHPWSGIGLGSFPAVFASIRPPRFLAVWDNVHNSYLQLALELGIPAAASLFASLAWLIGLCVRGSKVRRRNITFPALGLAASALVASHALIDFSAEIPAVATLYAALLGVAVSQSWPSSTLTATR